MNIYRLVGDACHQAAIVFLILQLLKSNNARGISVKTQELRLLVFATRYLDLFTTFYSLYNSIVKIVYIVATTIILVMCKTEPIKSVYNPQQDSFPHWKCAALPCAFLAAVTHVLGSGLAGFDVQELLWTFSIYLESIAILPQLMVLQKYRLVENLTGKFVFFLGMYRLFYIFNWIYRSRTEKNYRHHIVVYVCGVVQTLLYADFFYQYCKICREEDGIVDDDNDTGLIFEASNLEQTARSRPTSTALAALEEPLVSTDGQTSEEGEATLEPLVSTDGQTSEEVEV